MFSVFFPQRGIFLENIKNMQELLRIRKEVSLSLFKIVC
jgi:hypothetical protein